MAKMETLLDDFQRYRYRIVLSRLSGLAATARVGNDDRRPCVLSCQGTIQPESEHDDQRLLEFGSGKNANFPFRFYSCHRRCLVRASEWRQQ